MYTIRNYVIILVGLLMFNACSIEKRQHLKGFHIDFAHRKAQTQQTDKERKEERTKIASTVKEHQAPRKNLLASMDNSLAILESLEKERSKQEVEEVTNAPDSIVCDRLTLRTGDETAVKVMEITDTEVKYKRCNHLDGPIITIKKSEVFMIVYSNGTKDIFKVQPSSSQSGPKPGSIEEDEASFDVDLYAKAALVAGIMSLLMWILSFLLSWILALFAIIVGAYVLTKILKRDSKDGKGAAIGAIITGILGMIITSIVFIALVALLA